MSNSPREVKKILKKLNGEAAKIRKLERNKFIDKSNHLKKIRDEEEDQNLSICPEEIIDYKNIIVFNK